MAIHEDLEKQLLVEVQPAQFEAVAYNGKNPVQVSAFVKGFGMIVTEGDNVPGEGRILLLFRINELDEKVPRGCVLPGQIVVGQVKYAIGEAQHSNGVSVYSLEGFRQKFREVEDV